MGTGLLRFITAGSVDDGKSTLIGRLLFDSKGLFADQLTAVEAASRRRGFAELDLSLLTDGLLAEREQGITIDVAYRYFATPARKFIIGDSPGHEQYTRNMVTAASTADLAVLLVDARHGLRPQTHRHACLASWLGVPRIVLAINKMDLVGGDRARFEALRDEFARFAAPLGFRQVQAIPLSALRGDMVVERGELLSWYDGPTLLQHLETAPARHDDADARAASLRFPVQRVARVMLGNAQPGARLPDGHFRGYQGTVAAGRLRVGAELIALPSGARARVAGILTADGELDEAGPDRAVTVRLDREIDVSRGDLLAAPEGAPSTVREFDADLCWFDPEPLVPGRAYTVKQGCASVRAFVERVE
jgi:sulfate adenylyltransferase large subunit